MNKVIIALMPWIFAAIGYKATAQETKNKEDKKETHVITIKKTGDKNADLKIEFKGDAVLINGKPLVEFKEDNITFNNKKVVVKNGDMWSIIGDDGKAAYELDMKRFNGIGENFERSFAFGGSKTILGVTTDDDEDGAKVLETVKGSAAEKAGLQKGDIITKIDDTKIGGPSALSEIIAGKKPKDEVKVTYKRDGKEKTAKATLQERKGSDFQTFSFANPRGGMKTITVPGHPRTPGAPYAFNHGENFDFDFDNMIAGGFNRQKLGLKIQDLEEGPGVKVLEVEEGSAAEKAGLKKDDVITSVGDAKVENTDDAREELHKNASKSAYTIEAKRNGNTMKFDIKIPKKLKTANL